MVQATKEQIETFKSAFFGYIKEFGLEGYNVYFVPKKITEGNFADLKFDHRTMTAVVRVNTHFDSADYKHFDPEECAKHEAIHLLCSRLTELANARYATEGDIDSATEELVNRLGIIIPDVH